MTELFNYAKLRAGEDLQATVALDERAGNAPSLLAGSITLPTTESSHALVTSESLHCSTDGSTARAGNIESGQVGKVVGANAETNEVSASGTQPPALTKPDSETGALYTQVKGMIAGRTGLQDSVSALITFWAISTWFLEAFPVFPLLAITGPAHEAMVVLGVLNDLCWAPTLLAGFRRADLKDLNGYRTLLISEPNLDNRTAALLGNLTNRHFILVEERSYLYCAGSRAVYVGEESAIKKIQHAIWVNVTTPPHVDPPIPSQSRPETISSLRDHLSKYRNRNLGNVRSLGFHPRGLSSETHAIANVLGSCVVDAPHLQSELVSLLRPQHAQHIADRSSSVEALAAGAALALFHKGKDEIYVKEIAAEVNRLLVVRGETMQLSPEKVGHKLKRVGLFTRRLSQAGNGLTLDQATRIRLHEVARAFQGEDSIPDTENLHCQLCTRNECFREVM
jgi:hypothetical protein